MGLPLLAAMEAEGVLHRMPELVPEQLQALLAGAALDLEHHLALEAHQARMGEVEGDGDAGDVLRGEPLVGEPEVGPEAQVVLLELAEHLLDVGLDPAPLDREVEVAQAQVEQGVSVEALPVDGHGGEP